jgi:S1-C subfamily serine protease
MKKLAMGVAQLLSGLFLLALPIIFICGLTWVSGIVSPWLIPAFFCTLAISIFILGPLAVIRKTRVFSAAGLMVASYVFGACLWITSLLLTYELWGTIAVIIGLAVLGIGIVPVALLAALFHGQWWHLLDLVMLIVATFGTRLLAGWLAEKVDSDQYAQAGSQSDNRRRTGKQDWIMRLSMLCALAVLMFIFGRWLPPNVNLSAAQVFSQTAGSVIRIEIHRQDGSEMIGSGFVTVLQGHPCILTNKHVVQNAERVKVGVEERLLFDVQNYWLARNVDLAVLEIPAELQAKTLLVRKTPAQPGEIVYTIGFPMGLAKSITQGLVTATYVDALQFDAPISSGNSGGPVLDVHAEVIGVVAIGSKDTTEAILQNLNFAVPVTNLPPLESFQRPPHVAEPLAVATPTVTSGVGPTTGSRRALPTPYYSPLFATPSYPTLSPQMTATPALLAPNSTPNVKGAKWPDGRKLLHPDKSVTTRVVNVEANDTLKLRSGPGTSFRILAEIPADETKITAFNYDQVWDGDTWWCPVEWKGLRGYVGRSHLPKP